MESSIYSIKQKKFAIKILNKQNGAESQLERNYQWYYIVININQLTEKLARQSRKIGKTRDT